MMVDLPCQVYFVLRPRGTSGGPVGGPRGGPRGTSRGTLRGTTRGTSGDHEGDLGGASGDLGGTSRGFVFLFFLFAYNKFSNLEHTNEQYFFR